ncbi:hypothetical protein [Ruegeria atlantica]|uniref:UDP-glucose 6-dehydrogenase n=1 Tax=Ruegeria atlantica TaxID=81569 RepID=A0A0P1EKZ5_9RHOB|nr:UDP-glucose 6-dehydrogenase TuaD [Ruegeria atlantica]
MIKYAANTFLATKTTLINEIAGLRERVGGDVKEVVSGIRLDGRIGKNSFMRVQVMRARAFPEIPPRWHGSDRNMYILCRLPKPSFA